MRIRSPQRHLKKGLTHPNRLVAAATWLLVLLLGWVLVRLVMALVDDFWLLVIVWSQP